MSIVSTSLERANQWDQICFPVHTLPLAQILPSNYELLASDRQTAIVGEGEPGSFQVFALQGKDYSLIPNKVLREVVDSCIPDYKLDIHYSDRGEFSIAIILPQPVRIGEEQVYKTLILNNSYTGKTPFTIQGTTLKDERTSKARISFYRQLCANSLMGWADDFSSLEQYQSWLGSGQRPIINNSLVNPTSVVHKKISHKKLDLSWFEQYLKEVISSFLSQHTSVTAQVHSQLTQISPPKQVQELIVETGIPKQLAKIAMERLRKEEKMLKTEPTLWLVYNAINYSLLNSRSSLTIGDRYELDKKALHHLAALAF
jgi:hypothetical protein